MSFQESAHLFLTPPPIPMVLELQMCAGDLNSGPHAYKAIAWQAKSSLQPLICFVFKKQRSSQDIPAHRY